MIRAFHRPVMPPGRRTKRGFTLIELVVIIVVLGILSAVAIPRFVDLSDQAKLAALKGILGNLRSAIHLYSAENLARGVAKASSYPPNASLYACLENTSTDSDLPADPIGNSSTVTYSTTTPLKGQADGTAGGYKYNYQTGEVIVNHTTYDEY